MQSERVREDRARGDDNDENGKKKERHNDNR